MPDRLLSYRTAQGLRAGVMADGEIYDLEMETGMASIVDALQQWPAISRTSSPIKGAVLGPPLQNPGNIYCAGANYSDHVREMALSQGLPEGPGMKEIGEKPWHFIKSGRSSIIGPGDAVSLPAYSNSVDWEIELVAVMGREAKNVTVEQALDYVAGYTIANDLSARDASRRPLNPPGSPFFYDWISHKSFDGSCPLGPWIVAAAEVGNPQNLGLKLWVGDELMQDSSTSEMIFSVAEQIAMLSSRVTLHPGDLILTGTPAGVGKPRNRYLRAGETVTLWIEKIGEFKHHIRD